jgi:hypothetical protein
VCGDGEWFGEALDDSLRVGDVARGRGEGRGGWGECKEERKAKAFEKRGDGETNGRGKCGCVHGADFLGSDENERGLCAKQPQREVDRFEQIHEKDAWKTRKILET